MTRTKNLLDAKEWEKLRPTHHCPNCGYGIFSKIQERSVQGSFFFLFGSITQDYESLWKCDGCGWKFKEPIVKEYGFDLVARADRLQDEVITKEDE